MVYSKDIYIELWHNKVRDFVNHRHITLNICSDNKIVNEVVKLGLQTDNLMYFPLPENTPSDHCLSL